MSDPTAGTRGFIAGLIKAMEHMPEGADRDAVQAICDGVQARDAEGPVHWMTEDGFAVWVQPKHRRWESRLLNVYGEHFCWPHETRAEALADVAVLLAQARADRDRT